MWNHTFKYIKCPKKTVNVWEHQTICGFCVKEDVCNTTVKLGTSDSSTVQMDHFLVHHKEVWELLEPTINTQFHSTPGTPRSDRHTRLHCGLSIAGEGPSSSALAGKQDMDGLLSVEVNPLVWCKKYSVNFPYLAQITCRYLVIPSTTAPVERLFSVSGQVLTVKRNRLSLKQ